jgi:hypothetical protein
LLQKNAEFPHHACPGRLTAVQELQKTRSLPVFTNFILPGLGYGYIGMWWGIMIFQIDVTVTVWLFKVQGEANSYQILFPVYLILAVHAWYIARNIPDDPP